MLRSGESFQIVELGKPLHTFSYLDKSCLLGKWETEQDTTLYFITSSMLINKKHAHTQ